jgi:hypothetical protein
MGHTDHRSELAALTYGLISHLHTGINMSHIITEFSFGPYFPDITQPLDYSFETTDQPFVAFQYFLTVVPTTYVAPRSRPLHTYQYSVTHYVKQLEHSRGTPGIFFKYDIDPVALEIHQRTTTLTQFLVRIVGVIGGVWVCFGWGLKVASKVSQKAGITGDDEEPIAEVTGLSIKKRWGGSSLNLRRRPGGDDHNGNGNPWSTPMGTPSPYGSFSNQGTPASPYGSFQGRPASPYAPLSATGAQSSAYPPPPPSRGGGTFGFPPSPGPGAQMHLSPGPASPYTPSHFPASPLPNQSGFPSGSLAPPGSAGGGYAPASPLPPTPGSAASGGFAVQQQRSRPSSLVGTPPPRKMSALRNEKKDD